MNVIETGDSVSDNGMDFSSVDKGEDETVAQELYNKQNLQKMMVDKYNSTGDTKQTVFALNAVVEMLLGYNLVIKGEDRRYMELSDMHFYDSELSDGDPPFLSFDAKKEIEGEKEGRIHGVLRNRHSELCLITAVALSLWYRFDFEGGDLYGSRFPDFLDTDSYYTIKLLRTEDSTETREPISLQYEKCLIMSCFESVGSRKDHKALEEQADLNINEIERTGHWSNHEVTDDSYDGSDYDFLLHGANFSTPESYSISRAATEPSEELQKKIFPFIESTEEKISHQDELDLEALDVMDLLKSLRPVVLQELGVINDMAPGNIFATHPINTNPEYLEFKRRATTEI